MSDVYRITQALTAPFEPREVKFKPAVVSNNRALALAYVDARVIQDRLDEVLGVEGWQDEYDCVPDGSVVCRLRLRIGGEWVTKMDVGGPSEQPDGGDRLKAAFSDALKRAAVKFGVGRYLYRLPSQWVDYDPKKRQIVAPPVLPGFAQPKKKAVAKLADHRRPANGVELRQRLMDYEAKLIANGVCQFGELLGHVIEAGKLAGFEIDLEKWDKAGIDLAARETRRFEAKMGRTNDRMKAVA